MLTDPNCELLYPFENQANDYSGHARHGSVHGSGVYATRPNGGRCISFDGVGDFVHSPFYRRVGTTTLFACNIRCKLFTDPQSITSEGTISAPVHLLYRSPGNTYDLALSLFNGSMVTVFITNYFAPPFEDSWIHLFCITDFSSKTAYFLRNATLVATVALNPSILFPNSLTSKTLGAFSSSDGYDFLTNGYMQNVYFGSLPSCPSLAALTANAQRMRLGLHPIWSV